jgi:hypothetical protein
MVCTNFGPTCAVVCNTTSCNTVEVLPVGLVPPPLDGGSFDASLCWMLAPFYNKNISFFGSLREFDRLNKFCAYLEALGGNDEESRAPLRLKDTLPASLESQLCTELMD